MSDDHPLATELPEILLVSRGSTAFNTPNGVQQPFEPFVVDRSWYARECQKMTPRRWPTLLPLSQYNEMVQSLDRDELKNHIKQRREQTGEDLDASAKTDEMREALCYDIEAIIGDLTDREAASE